jgi:hypothetical protein
MSAKRKKAETFRDVIDVAAKSPVSAFMAELSSPDPFVRRIADRTGGCLSFTFTEGQMVRWVGDPAYRAMVERGCRDLAGQAEGRAEIFAPDGRLLVDAWSGMKEEDMLHQPRTEILPKLPAECGHKSYWLCPDCSCCWKCCQCFPPERRGYLSIDGYGCTAI